MPILPIWLLVVDDGVEDGNNSFILDENPIEAEAFVEQVVNFVRDVVQEAETCSEGWGKEWGSCEEWHSTQSMCGTSRTYNMQFLQEEFIIWDKIIIQDNHFYRTLGANGVTATSYSLTYMCHEAPERRIWLIAWFSQGKYVKKGLSLAVLFEMHDNDLLKGKKVDGSETILSQVTTQVKEATKLQEGHQSRSMRHSSKAIKNGNADLHILLVEATVHGLHDKVVALLAPYEKKFGPLTATKTAKVSDNEAEWDVSAPNVASTSNGIDHEYVERSIWVRSTTLQSAVSTLMKTSMQNQQGLQKFLEMPVFGKALSEKREKRKAETVKSLLEQSTRFIAANTTAASQSSKHQNFSSNYESHMWGSFVGRERFC
ncbi:hypothetical protein C8J56DRAFT_900164 [Mycena floridula]|nr:hypothetical protein C8J56DRAFT_900164 [Mycena floridula]